MIEEYAVITKRLESTAALEIERRTACGLCGQKRGCGNATWGKLLGHNRHEFYAENPINADVGASVVVGIDERAMLGSVFYLYVVPLIAMFVAAIFTDTFVKNQLYVVLSAVLGLILGFVWVKWRLVGGGRSSVKDYQAVILRLAEDAAGTDARSDVVSGSCSRAGAKSEDVDRKVVNFQTKRGE